jgi:hypothetical protein
MMRHMLRRAARRLAGRAPAAMHGVNNAISVFTDASSRFLTSLGEHLRFPLITSVGLLSPWLLHDIATGRRELARRHTRDFGYPVRAANLCLSARGAVSAGSWSPTSSTTGSSRDSSRQAGAS